MHAEFYLAQWKSYEYYSKDKTMELTYYFYLAAYFVTDQATVFIWAIKSQFLPTPCISLYLFLLRKGGRFFV